MKKNIQNKIVLIFFIVGILIIAGISAFTVYTLQKMSGTIDVSIPIRDLLIISAIALVLYILITIVIKYFVSKSVVKPINRLIESAEKSFNTEKPNRNYFITYDRWCYCF